MEMLISLWLPILLSGVAVFIASFLAWMVLPHHKGDWGALPNEDVLIDTLRNTGVKSGQYMFPHCSDAEKMKSEEFKRQWKEGPCGTLNVFPPGDHMAQNLACTLLFFLAVSFCIAYLAQLALAPGSRSLDVFQFVGTAGILTYCAGGILNAIWFKRKIFTDLVDGVAYGLITGAIFTWLWPGA